MGTSTDAILAYGYELGGPEEWHLAEASGEYGELVLPWYDEDSDADFIDAAQKLLSASTGFTEEWSEGNDGYFDRKRAAEARLGVVIDCHGHGDFPIYILAAHATTARRGQSEVINMAALTTAATEQAWDAKLAAAIQTLGITPTQDQPRWLLCSYWG